jgi:hypothetical protein
MKKYEWNEDTIDYFQFTSCYVSRSEIKRHITDFINLDCQLEDGDDEEEMVENLMSIVYK